MKKLFIYICAATLYWSMFSCTKLDENPIGLLAPEGFFKTKNDVQTAIFGAYGALAHESLYGRAYTCNMMLRGDMCDIGNRSTAAYRIQINDFGVTSTNQWMSQIWTQFYVVISCANTAEAGAKSLGLPDDEINPLVGEAKFIRAFSYYNLVRIFGDLPYIDYPITNPENVKSISKTSQDEIYKSIIADLQFAEQWLPDQQTDDTRTRPSKGAAASYLASVYLTLHDYQNAYKEAKYVIDNKDLFGYKLESDYQDLFRAEKAYTNKETIFAIDFIANLSSGSYNDDLVGPMTLPIDYHAGYGVVVPSLEVYHSFNPLDYRKAVSFDTIMGGKPYTSWTLPRPHIAKFTRYPGTTTQANYRYSDNNYADMRYAEVLLTAAEALAEINGPNTETAGYVNEVRTRARNAGGTMRAYPPDVPVGLDKGSFVNLVMEERRIEFAFEWKRWYDIKRRDIGDEVFKGSNSLEPHSNFDASRDYLFPIPQTELDVNPNLAPQNTGY